jgi:hypothetical protein
LWRVASKPTKSGFSVIARPLRISNFKFQIENEKTGADGGAAQFLI